MRPRRRPLLAPIAPLADRGTNAIPIIVVTGDATAGNVDRAKAAGADAVLTKPCPPATLLGAIRRVQEHSRQLSARAVILRSKSDEELLRSARRVARSRRRRHATKPPPLPPPTVHCPLCDARLRHQRHHGGGVRATRREQWDDFECPNGCGSFRYRHRTRKLTKTVA